MIKYIVYPLILSLFVLNLKKALHMFQQNRYEFDRYTNWLFQQIKVNVKNILLLLLTIFFLIASYWLQPYSILTLSTILAILNVVIYHQEKKKDYIKPLHYTNRVKRQWMFLLFVFLGASIWIYAQSELVLYAFSASALLLPWLCIYALILLEPIENYVKGRFKTKAKKKLQAQTALKIIGITGSYGKTSSKNILQAILSEQYYSLMTPASFNTPMGITRTIHEYLKPTHEVFICEMGADRVGDIKELMQFVQPQYGVVTSIGPQHLNTFKTMENIIQEKMQMIECLPKDGVGVLNYDNAYIKNYKISNTCRILTIAIEESEVDYQAINIEYTPLGTTFDVKSKDGIENYETRLLGKHNIMNILVAIALAKEFGITSQQLQHAIRICPYIQHRLELKNINGYTFIDNAFNSNPSGAKMSLEVLSRMPNRRFIITPGFIDLGSLQEEANYEFGYEMKDKVDVVILVGKHQTRPIYQGLQASNFDLQQVHVVDKVVEAFQLVYRLADKTDTILLENDLPDAFNH